MPDDKLQVQIPSERGDIHLLMRVSSTLIRGENEDYAKDLKPSTPPARN